MSDLTTWGHEFLRNLSGEVSKEYQARIGKLAPDAGEAEVEMAMKVK